MSGILKRAIERRSTLKRACGGGARTMSTLGKALDSGKRKKKEKKAADITPASGFVVLSGSREDQARQACEALTKMTPEVPAGSKPLMEPEPSLKHSSEKTALYSEPGEKVHVKSGPHKGKNGVVVSKKRVRHEERWLDDDGSDNRKDKTDESYTLEFDSNTQVTFDSPDEELEYYRESHEKESLEKIAEAREKIAEAREKLAYCSSGPYYSLGDKAKCVDGEHQGKTGIVTKMIEDDESSSKLDEDGAVSSRNKTTRKVTLKFEGGDTAEIDASKTEREYDEECLQDACEVSDKGAADAQERSDDDGDLQDHLEKIARLVSRRILNGDVALDKLIAAFTPKQADSDTVKARVQKNEVQEDVGEWPKGDVAGDAQQALRVEPTPSNIEKMDEAIDEAQGSE